VLITSGNTRENSVGWMGGFSFSFIPLTETENFNYFEFQGIYFLNVAHYKDNISLMIGYGGAIGLLHHIDENSLLLNAKIEMGPSLFNDVIMPLFSTGPAIITRYRFSNHDFGGPITFLTSVGVCLKPVWKINLTYRLQHMSNADLFRKNHRLNLHIIELNYHF
jgi:hypothetical protein